jgi:hypothetical protein
MFGNKFTKKNFRGAKKELNLVKSWICEGRKGRREVGKRGPIWYEK